MRLHKNVYKKIRLPLYHYFLHSYYRFTSVSIFDTHILYARSIPMYFDGHFFKNSYFYRFFLWGGGGEGRGVCEITSYLGAITNTQYMYLSKMHIISLPMSQKFSLQIYQKVHLKETINTSIKQYFSQLKSLSSMRFSNYTVYL